MRRRPVVFDALAWWGRLHGYRSLLPIAEPWVLLMLIFGGVEVLEIGPLRLAASAPIAVMLTFGGGFIVNYCVWLNTNVPISNPVRYAAARVAAVTGVLACACLVTVLGVLLRDSDPAASVRNLVFAFCAFYWTQRMAPSIYWLIPVTYLLVTMYFGMGQYDFMPWALPLVSGDSIPHLVFTGLLLILTLAGIAGKVPVTGAA